MGITSTILAALVAATPHRVDKVRQISLGDGLPLMLKKDEQLLEGCRWGMILANTTAQHVPCMLDGVHVGTVGWPVHPVDLCLLQEGVHEPCSMWGSIVIL